LEKSLKKQQRSNSRVTDPRFSLRFLKHAPAVLLSGAAVCFLGTASPAEPKWFDLGGTVIAAAPKSTKGQKPPQKPTETYQDLIEKAQNLSLQKDRLQASQILVRAIARETKGSGAYKALTQSLDELMNAFYTEKAQSTFTAAESSLLLKPREAIDGFTEALRLEDGNVTVIKALARAHLTLAECDKADGFVTKAESLDPYSAEILLLRLQVLDCNKQSEVLSAKLFPLDPSLVPLENFVHALQIKDLIRREETKKAKAVATQWESSEPSYPEVYYWKWMLSKDDKPDRAAAHKYVELCQNLSPRKRKSYNLDVDLCKGKETVDTFLKEPPHED
jgi:tetratricopeptide (TPR) repeat protein